MGTAQDIRKLPRPKTVSEDESQTPDPKESVQESVLGPSQGLRDPGDEGALIRPLEGSVLWPSLLLPMLSRLG